MEEVTAGAMEAAVIAELVKAGVSFEDAKAQVLGKKSEEVEEASSVTEEPEPPVIPQKSRDFSDDQVKLFNEVKEIADGNGMPSYKIELELPQYLFDWAARKTLQEAGSRNDPSFGLEHFLVFMIKQERAIDPTKGGKVQGGSSGPKDAYNPITERWG